MAIAAFLLPVGQNSGGGTAASGQFAYLTQRIERLKDERDRFFATANASESRINIERATQRQLVTQVKTLEVENTKLKEDLAFFESLLPANAGAQSVSIRRFMVEMVAPGQMRYRMLLMQGGKEAHEFSGNLQLVVTLLRDGKRVDLTLPGRGDNADSFRLAFKRYLRMEGVVQVPEQTAIQAVQARILERGQLRTQEIANL